MKEKQPNAIASISSIKENFTRIPVLKGTAVEIFKMTNTSFNKYSSAPTHSYLFTLNV